MNYELPSRWQTRLLAEICRIEIGCTPDRKNAAMWDSEKKFGHVWLTVSDLPIDLYAHAMDSKEYVSYTASETMRLVPSGTLLVSLNLNPYQIAYAGRDLYTNEAIAALHDVDKKIISKKFLYWYLGAYAGKKSTEIDQKTKRLALNKAKLKRIPVPIPPLEEQQYIVGSLYDVYRSLYFRRYQIDAYRENGYNYQSIVQAAFTGKLTDDFPLICS